MLNNTRPLPFRRTPRGRDRAPATPVPAHFAPHLVTLSSSSHAYAVSILPKGKMLDLQGGSSSSQKSRSAAIFGSPIIIARRVELSCAFAYRKTNAFPSLPSPFLRGKGDRLRWMRDVISLFPSPLFRHFVTPSPEGEGKTFVIPNKSSKNGKITLLPLFSFINNFARPKAAPFGKRTQFAAYLRLLQER